MGQQYPRRRTGRTGRPVIRVNGHSASWLNRGFCWVYPKEVTHRPKGVRPGIAVDVQGPDGKSQGTGIWDDGWLAVRLFRRETGPLDEEYLAGRLERALELRSQVVDPKTTAFRLVNAENDGLPGIRVDRYGWMLVVTLDSPSLTLLLDPLCELLQASTNPRAIYLAWRPDPRDRAWEAPRPAGLIRGHAPTDDVRVEERGVAARVRPGDSKDIGIYPDMRELRAWLEPHWGGRTVLNLFAHTGFFSVVAAFHGAAHVTSVDLRRGFLERAEDNFRANDLDPANHDFITEDVRRFLDRARRKERSWDLVLLDPPAFAHGPEGILSTRKSYPGLVAACLRVLGPGGWLVAALNLGAVSPKDFHGMVAQGARKAGRRLQLIRVGHQAPDFPAAVDFPEGRYLKAGVWRLDY